MTVLDEAYERLSDAWLENQQGFVNHGPMVCEALYTLGLEDQVVAWADRSSRPQRDLTVRRPGRSRITEWPESLGTFSLLDDWVDHFELAIAGEGWRETVATWAPRLMPSMGTLLFHSLIRTAHITRAIACGETEPRAHELAFSLGYWAARYGHGRQALPVIAPPESDLEAQPIETIRAEIGDLAAKAAHRFVAHPDIFTLHGVTGAMAVHLLAEHVSVMDAQSSVAQLATVHQAFFGDQLTETIAQPRGFDRVTLALNSARTGNVHAVKLTEAALRGFDSTEEPVFRVAAELAAEVAS